MTRDLPTNGSVLSMAGLWDQWKDIQTGEPVRSCTIVVTEANALTRAVHDRMPVLLPPDMIEAWVSGQAGAERSRRAVRLVGGHRL